MHVTQREYTYAMQNAWGDKELSSTKEGSQGGHTAKKKLQKSQLCTIEKIPIGRSQMAVKSQGKPLKLNPHRMKPSSLTRA
jgi:hypothetical protein